MPRKRRLLAAGFGRLIAAAVLVLPGVVAAASSNTECCVSVTPEFPPATAYGAHMVRPDDSRSQYRPFVPLRPEPPANVDEVNRRIVTQEALHGPYADSLVSPLRDLGAALQHSEDFLDAGASYARAIHLLRINEGLKTPAQAPLVEQLIEVHLAVGRIEAADQQQQYLFDVRRAHYRASDPEMRVAVEQYADWQRAAYLAEVDDERFHRLLRMIDVYAGMADEVAAEHGENSRDILPYLRGKLTAEYLLSVYQGERDEGLQVSVHQKGEVDLPQIEEMRFYRLKKFNYRYGRETIQRMQSILAADESASTEEVADAKVALGDWYQWHRRYAQAVPVYEEAWQHAAASDTGQGWHAATFGAPLELPSQIVFHPGRLPLRTQHDADVRARFGVSRHGKATDIEVVPSDVANGESAVVRTYKFLRDMRFRPRVEDGRVVATEQLERAYHIRF